MNGNSSSLIIQTPTRQQLSKSGLQAFASLPTDRRICYGVSIKGSGVDGFAGSECSPATGAVAGFIEEGGALELFVTKGENRTIELYAFLMPALSTDACPTMGQNLTGDGLRSTFLIGSKSGVSVLADTETVTILIDFPGLNNSLASQMSVPDSCTPGLPAPRKGFFVSSGSGVASNANHTLRARIGQPKSGTLATGSGYQLY